MAPVPSRSCGPGHTQKTRKRSHTVPLMKKVSICVALLLFVSAFAVAQNSGQVIFSKTGGLMTIAGNSNHVTSTPFGFWIWCNAETAPNSNGGYQAAHACQGEMYFYGF